VIKPSKLL